MSGQGKQQESRIGPAIEWAMLAYGMTSARQASNDESSALRAVGAAFSARAAASITSGSSIGFPRARPGVRPGGGASALPGVCGSCSARPGVEGGPAALLGVAAGPGRSTRAEEVANRPRIMSFGSTLSGGARASSNVSRPCNAVRKGEVSERCNSTPGSHLQAELHKVPAARPPQNKI